MVWIRDKLTGTHLDEARKLVASKTGDGTIFADDKTDGLVLRVRKTAATFSLKYAGKTRVLGTLSESAKGKINPGEIQTIQAARDLAEQVRALLKDGTDPTLFLSGKAAGKSDDSAKNAAERQVLIDAGFWTWERLISEYTDGYLSQPRLVKKRMRPPSLRSADTARKSLIIAEANGLKGRLISELSLGDLEEVRDACAKAGRKTASRAFVANAKAALSFARKMHARKSGLEGSPKWWLELAPLHSTQVAPRMRRPKIEDLARTLYAVEKHRVIEGRKIERATSEITICAVWWLALVAQRSNAALSLETAQILPWPADQGPANGWKVVLWSEEVMKSRQFHSLPIPPRVALLLERAAMVARKGSKYAFPATALRKGVDDAHLDKNTFKNLMERLRGKRKNPKGGKASEETGVDLLAGIEHFSPHDIRRLFGTTCSDLKVRGDAISAVLDHAGIEDEIGQKVIRSAEVTRLAYDHSQRLPLKRDAMEVWADVVFEACDKVWRNENPMRMDIRREQTRKADLAKMENVDPRRGIAFSPWLPWYQVMEMRMEKQRKPLILPASAQRADEMSGDVQ
ncbi:integrase [Ochrobactrum sp. 19YEA23]|uniref:integrase arm-type DNA-binding domain-containing protein n=1 Tax=Ochrobactrum sp. 19YEA23 TaxID=3039854 RepID=UPI0024784B06|nr:integrase [Ochrobactrum sp. 19YEA23]